MARASLTQSKKTRQQFPGELVPDGLLHGASRYLLVLLEDEVGLVRSHLSDDVDEGVLIGAQFGLSGAVEQRRLLGRFLGIHRCFISGALDQPSIN